MNNKGQTLGLTVLSAIIFLVVGLMMVNFVMDEVSTARNNLSCASASSISDGTKLLCLMMDTTVIYSIITIFSIIIGLFIGRLAR